MEARQVGGSGDLGKQPYGPQEHSVLAGTLIWAAQQAGSNRRWCGGRYDTTDAEMYACSAESRQGVVGRDYNRTRCRLPWGKLWKTW